MKKNNCNMTDFEMVIENNNSFIIKKVYPESLSNEEIEKAEKEVPNVILHCFDPAKVLELQTWGEKIAMEHLKLQTENQKTTTGIFGTIKSIFF